MIYRLYCHPFPRRSRVNAKLWQATQDLAGVESVELYESYPDFEINVQKEKARLIEANILVLQFPLYWYSSPALLKEWFDVVLESGFAYGPGGTALKGKGFWPVVTVGGSTDSYQAEGTHRFSIERFLTPFEQTAAFCGMKYIEPFLVMGASALTENELEAVALNYRRALEDASQGRWPRVNGGS